MKNSILRTLIMLAATFLLNGNSMALVTAYLSVHVPLGFECRLEAPVWICESKIPSERGKSQLRLIATKTTPEKTFGSLVKDNTVQGASVEIIGGDPWLCSVGAGNEKIVSLLTPHPIALNNLHWLYATVSEYQGSKIIIYVMGGGESYGRSFRDLMIMTPKSLRLTHGKMPEIVPALDYQQQCEEGLWQSCLALANNHIASKHLLPAFEAYEAACFIGQRLACEKAANVALVRSQEHGISAAERDYLRGAVEGVDRRDLALQRLQCGNKGSCLDKKRQTETTLRQIAKFFVK